MVVKKLDCENSYTASGNKRVQDPRRLGPFTASGGALRALRGACRRRIRCARHSTSDTLPARQDESLAPAKLLLPSRSSTGLVKEESYSSLV